MQDFITDTDGDILIDSNGDFAVGFSDQEHQQWLVLFEKGSIKENPTACVGGGRYIESERAADLLREIAMQYSGDGLRIETLKIDEQGKVQVAAQYV